MKKLITGFLFFLSFWGVPASTVSASTIVNLVAVEDSYTSSFFPTDNHGGTGGFEIMDQSTTTTHILEYAYFKFDLSSIPNGANLIGADFYAYIQTYSAGGGQDIQSSVFFVSDDSWQESTITWQNAPGPDSGVLDTQTYPRTASWLHWDLFAGGIPAEANDQLLDSDDQLSLMLAIAESMTANATIGGITKDGLEGYSPYLQLEYESPVVPEPASILLFGFGLIGTIFRRQNT